jgi:hypothetical protein
MTSLSFGMKLLPFYCHAFGEKGKLKASMIKRERARIDGFVFLKPFLSGSLLPHFSMSLVMQIFVLFFIVLDLLGISLAYVPCTWGCTLCF